MKTRSTFLFKGLFSSISDRLKGDFLLVATVFVVLLMVSLGAFNTVHRLSQPGFPMGLLLFVVVLTVVILSARIGLESSEVNCTNSGRIVSLNRAGFLKLVFRFVFLSLLAYLSYLVWSESTQRETVAQEFFASFTDRGVIINVLVVDEPVEYPEYYQATGIPLEAIGAGVLFRLPKYHRLQMGQQCRLSGTLNIPESFNGFDYREYLETKNIFRTMYVNEYECMAARKLPPSLAVKRLLVAAKSKLIRKIERNLPEPESSLLAGILFGQKRIFSKGFDTEIKNAGVSHVVAASGYNISFIVLGVSKLFSPLSKRLRVTLSIVLVWTYCLMSGLSPSIVRAGLMYSLAALFMLNGRYIPVLNILTLTLAAFLLAEPRILSDIGFQLSYASTAGLLYLSPLLSGLFKRLGLAFSPDGVFLPTLACTLATMPITVAVFKKIPLLSVLTNTIVLPFIDSVMLLGVSALGSISLFPTLGRLLFLVVWVQLRFFSTVVRFFGSMEWGVIDLSTVF